MTRFLVSSSLDAANAIVDKINENGRLLYKARGYTIDENGAIICRNAATGIEDTKAQRTITWDIPRQRLDGKWVVLHPENHVSSQMSIDANETKAVSVIMNNVVPESIETDPMDGSWFVIPDIYFYMTPDEKAARLAKNATLSSLATLTHKKRLV